MARYIDADKLIALVQERGDGMSDTIERQAAIDVFYELWGTSLTRTVEAIKQLPSVQPKVIRCKDCKQYRRWIDTDICFCDITESERSDNDFCSRAERREE